MRWLVVPRLRHLLIAAAALAALAVAAAEFPRTGKTRAIVLVELEMDSSRDGVAELTVDYGRGFSSHPDATAALAAGRRTLLFRIAGVPERLRLLPFRGSGSGAVHAVRIRDGDRGRFRELQTFPIGLNQVLSLDRQRGGFRFITTDTATEPYVELVTRQAPLSWPQQLKSITPARAFLAGALLITLIGAGLVCAVDRALTHAKAPPAKRRQVLVALAAVVVLIIGGKLAMARAYGTQIPFLDAWSGEAIATFLPFGWGRLQWADLFAAHYEHRIVLTRVFDLFLLNVNGQWDELVHTMMNGLLHGAAMSVLILLLWAYAGGRRLDLLSMAAVAICVLPFAWQNSLAGFQSGFYFLLVTLLVPLGLVPGSSPRRAGWWIGMALLLLGLFSLASGILNVGAVAFSVILARWLLGERQGWRASIVGCAVVAAIGVWARVPVPPWHIPAMARTAGQFLTLTFSQLAFPHVERPWAALLVWAPSLFLGCWMIWRRRPPSRLEILLLTLGGWVGLQAAASGYTRGAVMVVPPSRYMDVFSLGILLNLTAIAALGASRLTTRGRRWVGAAAVLWVAWVVTGLVERSREALPDMALRRSWDQRYIDNMNRYLADNNAATVAKLAYPSDLPFIDGAALANVVLSDPAFRERLPLPIRDPLPMSVAAGGDVFVAGGTFPSTPAGPRPSRGSYTSRGNASQGEFRSAPLQCRHGAFMAFEIAGYLGREGTEMAIVDLERQTTRRVELPGIAAESWHRSIVRCPSGAFEIVARDGTPDWWWAFRAPVEIGPLSVAAAFLAERWWIFIAAGAVLAWFAAQIHERAEPRSVRRRVNAAAQTTSNRSVTPGV